MPTHGTNPAPEWDCGKQTRDNNHVISPDLAFPAGISWLFRKAELQKRVRLSLRVLFGGSPHPNSSSSSSFNPSLPGLCRTPTLRSPTFLRSFSETWTSSPRTSSRGWFSCGSGSGPSAAPCWMRWGNLGISPSQLLQDSLAAARPLPTSFLGCSPLLRKIMATF